MPIALELKLTAQDLKNIDEAIDLLAKEKDRFDDKKHLETTPVKPNETLN